MAELLDCMFSSDLGKLTAIFERINVNCVIPGTDGCTPLHIVAGMENSENNKNLVSFLLDKGANPNARSFEKLTPVHIAAMWNNCSQLETLLQNKGNPWLTDCENKNSFDMAADNFAYEAYQLLNIYLKEDKLYHKNHRKLSTSSKSRVNFELAQSKNEYSRAFSNTMFMTANENFPLTSSLGSSDESDLNISNCNKKKHSSKENQNRQAKNDSVWNISKCIKRSCSMHKHHENGSSERCVWNINKFVKENHSPKHNQDIQSKNDSSGKSAFNFSKCAKGNRSSKHNQDKIDSSEESVLYIGGKYINKENSSNHNLYSQAENVSSEESILCIGENLSSKPNQINHAENNNNGESDLYASIRKKRLKHNLAKNVSNREDLLTNSKCIKENRSTKHAKAGNDKSEKGILYISKCNKGDCAKHTQAESEKSVLYISDCAKGDCSKYTQAGNDKSEKSILYISAKGDCSNHNEAGNDSSGDSGLTISIYSKGSNSSKHNQAEKVKDSNYSKPKINTTYKVTPRSTLKQFNSSTKFHGNNLNHVYFFSSSESETSDIAPCTLNYSDDSSVYKTIIESDDKSEIVLVEMRGNTDNVYPDASVCSVASSWKSFQNVDDNCSILSCSSHSKVSVIVPESLLEYSNSRIYQELVNLGDNPGPVLDHTRHVYLLRLARLKTGCKVSCEFPKPKYCPEIYQFIENKLDMIRAKTLEKIMAAEFAAVSNKEWREGNQRCCFNYFLLDPRVTQNLPTRASNLTIKETFLIFLDSLFYVGKGTGARPYSHLFEAAKLMETKRWKSAKITHILEIWKAGLGVISLHCFFNSIPVEAYTREACILEALGMDNLTNIRKGDYYGSSAKLTISRKRLIGISLLERALQIFLLEDERQIMPKDVKSY